MHARRPEPAQRRQRAKPLLRAHQLAYIYGSRALITNNIFAGPTRGGVHVDSSSSNVVVLNDIYRGTPAPLAEALEQG